MLFTGQECFNIQIGKFNKNSSFIKYNSYMIGLQVPFGLEVQSTAVSASSLHKSEYRMKNIWCPELISGASINYALSDCLVYSEQSGTSSGASTPKDVTSFNPRLHESIGVPSGISQAGSSKPQSELVGRPEAQNKGPATSTYCLAP